MTRLKALLLLCAAFFAAAGFLISLDLVGFGALASVVASMAVPAFFAAGFFILGRFR